MGGVTYKVLKLTVPGHMVKHKLDVSRTESKENHGVLMRPEHYYCFIFWNCPMHWRTNCHYDWGIPSKFSNNQSLPLIENWARDTIKVLDFYIFLCHHITLNAWGANFSVMFYDLFLVGYFLMCFVKFVYKHLR